MPANKSLNTLEAKRKLTDGTMSLEEFRRWALDKFGDELGERVYQNAKGLKSKQLKGGIWDRKPEPVGKPAKKKLGGKIETRTPKGGLTEISGKLKNGAPPKPGRIKRGEGGRGDKERRSALPVKKTKFKPTPTRPREARKATLTGEDFTRYRRKIKKRH